MKEYELLIPYTRAADLEHIAFQIHRMGVGRWYYFREPHAILIRCVDLNHAESLSMGLGVPYYPRQIPNHDTEGWGEAWPTVVESFIANTAVAVLVDSLNKRRIIPPQLNASKYVHCLLNTLGWEREDEIAGYAEWAGKHQAILMAERLGKDVGPMPLIRRGRYSF